MKKQMHQHFGLAIAILVIAGMLLPSSPALAAPSYVPTPQLPNGLITDTTPTFQWTVEPGATHYQVQVKQGGTIIYTIGAVPGGGVCGASTCTKTPATILSIGEYAWKVRAKVAGVWGAWSPFKVFKVQTLAGFNHPFTNPANITLWTPINGLWLHDSAIDTYWSSGLDLVFSSTRHDNSYTSLTFEAQIRRTSGIPGKYQGIFVRASLGGDCPNGLPANGIFFEVTEDADWGVWVRRACEWISVVSENNPGIVLVADYNTLKVTANGNFYQFFINGIKLADGYLDRFGSGYVGVYMWDNEGYLDINFAKLSQTAPAADLQAGDEPGVIHLGQIELGEAVDR